MSLAEVLHALLLFRDLLGQDGSQVGVRRGVAGGCDERWPVFLCAAGKKAKMFIFKCYLIKAEVMRRLFTRKIVGLVVEILAVNRWLASLPIFRVECLRQLMCSSIGFLSRLNSCK